MKLQIVFSEEKNMKQPLRKLNRREIEISVKQWRLNTVSEVLRHTI